MISQIKRSPYFRTALMALAALLALGIGVRIVTRLADQSHERELHKWQMLLNRDADSRANAVNQWLEKQFDELEALATNASLRLYMTEIQHNSSSNSNQSAPSPRKKQTGDSSYQTVYLGNLIALSAQRAGFENIEHDLQIKANVERKRNAGIVLLDKERNPIVKTMSMPALEGDLEAFVKRVIPAGKAISDIFANSEGQASIAFAVPVFAVQADPKPENQLGMIIGTKPVGPSLFSLLQEPGATEKTLETMLVSADPLNNALFYLSPLKDGTPAISKMIDATNDNIASVFAVSHPGRFGIKHDYAFNEVLVTGRKLDIAPWFLVHKIGRDEALHDSDENARLISIIGFTILAFLTASFIAVWRYGISVRATGNAARYKKLAEDFAAQKDLLSLLSDYKPEALYIVDEEGKCCFANIEASRQAALASPKEAIGKTMAALIGKDRSLTYTQLNSSALVEKRITSHVQRLPRGEEELIIQSRHIPLDHIPGVNARGVLILEQDITVPMMEKERFAGILSALIQTLINLVDTRDKFTANHSTRVSQLARAVAAEMELDFASLDTVETAGLLMNLGKMFVPLDTLTKTGKLTKKENSLIDTALENSAKLLENIHFDGPVAESIKQAHALRTGKRVNNALTTARVIHTANMFVSMLSPRAYRDRLSIDKALEALNSQAKNEGDRAILAALSNYLENHGGRELWENLTKKPSKKS